MPPRPPVDPEQVRRLGAAAYSSRHLVSNADRSNIEPFDAWCDGGMYDQLEGDPTNREFVVYKMINGLPDPDGAAIQITFDRFYFKLQRPRTHPHTMLYSGSMSYDLPLMAKVRVTAHGSRTSKDDVVETELEVLVGNLPILVRSQHCWMRGHLEDHPEDPGGYFIVNGSPRVPIAQEQIALNRIFRRKHVKKDQWTVYLRCRAIESTAYATRAFGLSLDASGCIIARHSFLFEKHNIPLGVLVRALGGDLDPSRFNTPATDPTLVATTLADTNGDVGTQAEAKDYLARRMKTAEHATKTQRSELFHTKLMPNLLPHTKNPLRLIEHMAAELMACVRGERVEDEVDHMANKRYEDCGTLMRALFGFAWGTYVDHIRKKIHVEFAKKASAFDVKDNIAECFKSNFVTTHIRGCMSTGNWVVAPKEVARVDVTQALKTENQFAVMTHVRKSTSSAAKGTRQLEPRYLHTTQFGTVCSSQTPESGKTGIQKQLALFSFRSTVYDPAKIGLEEFQFPFEGESRLFVNGELRHQTVDGPKTRESIKLMREMGEGAGAGGAWGLPFDVGVTYDAKTDTIDVRTDEGRLVQLVAKWPLCLAPPRRFDREILNTILGQHPGEVEVLLDWRPFGKFRVDATKALAAIRTAAPPWFSVWISPTKTITDHDTKIVTVVGPEKLCLYSKFDASFPPEGLFYPSIESMVCGGGFEVLDVEEIQRNCMLATSVSDAILKYPHTTHLQLSPTAFLGVLANTIPLANHNAAPRLTYCLNQKQAGYGQRPLSGPTWATESYEILHPQKALTTTRHARESGITEGASNHNVAFVMINTDLFNQEDSLVLNQAAVDRGMFDTWSFYVLRCRFEETDEGYEDAAAGTDAFGMPEVGRKVSVGDALITRRDKISGQTKNVVVAAKHVGYVDSVRMIADEEGVGYTGFVRIRRQRKLSLGSKLCTENGQKGLVGNLRRQEDMPFSPKTGMVPDVIINPHAFFTRKTMGYFLEMLFGKIFLADATEKLDGTAFLYEEESWTNMPLDEEISLDDYYATNMEWQNNFHAALNEWLRKFQLANDCTEMFVDPRTGLPLCKSRGSAGESCSMFTQFAFGPVAMTVLKQKAEDKISARRTGPVDITTRQPPQGLKNQGGGKKGTMEKDCFVAHGAAAFEQDRGRDNSDAFDVVCCRECGAKLWAAGAGAEGVGCACGGTETFVESTRYAFILVDNMFGGLNVGTRLIQAGA